MALAGCASGSPSPSEITALGPQPPSASVSAAKQLLGGALTLRGMTSDGWIVYSDDQARKLRAVPLSGGDVQDIVPLGDSFAISILGETVFAWSDENAAGVGPLTAWTSSAGPRALSAASLAPWVAATSDGSHILYLDKVDSTGQRGLLAVTSAGEATPRVLLTGLMDLSIDRCQPRPGFAGSYVVVAHCDFGVGWTTISSFDMAGWKRTDLAASVDGAWSADPAGTLVLTATSAGLVVVPLGGGSATMIDPSGGAGVLEKDGQTAIYGASTSMLRRSSVHAPSPTTLVGSGFGGLYGVSPDGRFALYYGRQDPQTLVSDLYLTSTTAPGAPAMLSGTQSARVFGDAFTADGSHLLYATDVDVTAQTMTIDALALGSASPTVLTDSGSVVRAATGAKVVFGDHYTWAGGRGHADIRSADTSKGGDATLLVGQADAEFFLSPAHDRVVYTWSLEDGPRSGLYVVDIP